MHEILLKSCVLSVIIRKTALYLSVSCPKERVGEKWTKNNDFLYFLFYEIKGIMISILNADLRCGEDKTNKNDYLRIKNKRYILTR